MMKRVSIRGRSLIWMGISLAFAGSMAFEALGVDTPDPGDNVDQSIEALGGDTPDPANGVDGTIEALGVDTLEPTNSVDQRIQASPEEMMVAPMALPGATTPAPTAGWNSSPSSGAQDLSTDSGYSADPQVAASSTHVVVTQRSSIGFFNRTGTQLTHTNGDTFFSGLLPPGGAGTFDLRVIYDRWRHRFAMVGLVHAPNGLDDRVLVAYSQSSNPTGGWCKYAFAGNGGAVDYPSVGVGATALTITYSVWAVGTALRVLPAQQMADCTPFNSLTGSWMFSGLTAGGEAFRIIQPAIMHTSPAGSPVFAVGRYGSAGVTVFKVTNPLLSTRALTQFDVAIQHPFATVPPDVPQPGTSFVMRPTLNATTPVFKAVYRQGELGFVTSDAHDWGGGTTASIRFVTLNATTGAVSRNRKWGASGFHYAWPAVEVNDAGDWAVSFLRGSSTSFLQSRYSAWGSGDTDFRPSVLLRDSGTNWRTPDRCGGFCGDGLLALDSAGASLDPNGTSIWFSQGLPAANRAMNFTQWISRVYGP